MAIFFYQISEIKKKFGSLLSLLFNNAHIEFANISKKMVMSHFLDLFEDNRLEDFMDISNEDLAKQLFPNCIIDDRIGKDIGPVYWCGIQYMNIFMNYRIPLRVLFLLCPLQVMIGKFEIYHEMNEIELCKDFLKNELENVSILKYFRKEKGLSVRSLSFLTNIPYSTIRYYEKKNVNLFEASLINTAAINFTLQIDSCFFRKKSSFLPINYQLLQSTDFLECFKEIYANFTNKELGNSDIIIKQSTGILIINGGEIILDKNVFEVLLSKAIDKYLQKYLEINLVF